MAEVTVVRAELQELKDDLSDVQPGGKRVPVQFNPESLKLSYANQIQPQNNGSSNAPAPRPGRGSANQSQGTPARQFVGAGTTKLAVQLWFDVSAATAAPFMVDDVRRLTAEVLYFMKPKDPGAGARDASQRIPPGVRFSWGGFLFDGIVESLEENVEFFSPDGKALRASVTLNLIQQSILVPAFQGTGAVTRSPAGGATPGAAPLAAARNGQSLQQMSDSQPGGGLGGGLSGDLSAGLSGGLSAGLGANLSAGLSAGLGGGPSAGGGPAFSGGGWQRIAVANGIENPRALAPGRLIDLNAQRPRIVTD
ncbi:MAG: peptidoglycan-binding protein [Candidatus Competibacteraceae bacterium]